jgi:hypothetical protein
MRARNARNAPTNLQSRAARYGEGYPVRLAGFGSSGHGQGHGSQQLVVKHKQLTATI